MVSLIFPYYYILLTIYYNSYLLITILLVFKIITIISYLLLTSTIYDCSSTAEAHNLSPNTEWFL
jgi:hypothetical protein